MSDESLVTKYPIDQDPTRPRALRLADLLGELASEAERRNEARRTGKAWGPVTGFPKLDAEFGGALPSGLHVIHGGPGVGKTALGLQIAASSGVPALYVSAEMNPVELLRRHTARVSKTSLGRLKSGEMPPTEVIQKANEAAAEALLLTILDATTAYASPAFLSEIAEVVRGDSPDLLIVLDSVHSWAEGSGAEVSEYELLAGAITALRTLASRLNCPLLAIAERNRAGMKEGGLHAAAGGRGFEYKGESVWSLEANQDAENASGEVPVTLSLAKNRHGCRGAKVELSFHGALQRFKEA
jgi:replicative DNA helicase